MGPKAGLDALEERQKILAAALNGRIHQLSIQYYSQ
jgi:hypothetical protein